MFFNFDSSVFSFQFLKNKNHIFYSGFCFLFVKEKNKYVL